MKVHALKDIILVGFSEKEREAIRKVGGSEDNEFSLESSQAFADAVGCDVLTVIQPGGNIAIVKAGE